MEARAILRNFRMSPRKVRLVVDLVRGKPLAEALAILRYTPGKAAPEVARVIKSAAANAENNFQMSPEDLIVKKIYVDAGPTLKRMLPRARGRADMMHKRTCHITVVVDDGQLL